MKFQVSHTALALFFGAVLIAAPAIIGAKGPLSYDQAFAGPGKSGDHGGKGKSGDHGKGGGKSKKSSAAADEEVEEEPKNKKGKLASKLGALNAYHASPNAYKNASINSRVGKINAYWEKLQELETNNIKDEYGELTKDEQTELNDMLNAAANKPIDLETRLAFDQLLRDKFGDAAADDDSEDGEEETQ